MTARRWRRFGLHTLGTNGRIKENGCSKDLELIMRLAKDGWKDGREEREEEEEEGRGKGRCAFHFYSIATVTSDSAAF